MVGARGCVADRSCCAVNCLHVGFRILCSGWIHRFVRPVLPPQVNNLGELLFPEQFTGLHLVFVKGSGCRIEHENGGKHQIRIGCRDKLLIEGLEFLAVLCVV